MDQPPDTKNLKSIVDIKNEENVADGGNFLDISLRSNKRASVIIFFSLQGGGGRRASPFLNKPMASQAVLRRSSSRYMYQPLFHSKVVNQNFLPRKWLAQSNLVARSLSAAKFQWNSQTVLEKLQFLMAYYDLTTDRTLI